MGEHKLGTKVRAAIKAAHDRRLKRQKHQHSRGSMKVMPARRSLSTRGERGDTWNTKRWTECRMQERAETLERRRKMELDRQAKAKSKAEHIERTDPPVVRMDPPPRSLAQSIFRYW